MPHFPSSTPGRSLTVFEESLREFTRLYADLFAEGQVKGLTTALETALLSAPVTKRKIGAKVSPLLVGALD